MALGLRVSDPSFPDIRKTGDLYVDKTQYLYRMITSGKMFSCARPRRFGKTLLVSTLEAIFQGKRELFKGLYIDSTDYDWKTSTEFAFSMPLGIFLFFCDPSAVTNEEHTSKGRIDMVFRLEKSIYIFEYKVDQEPEVALKQIKDKHYADRFKAEGKPIHLAGISFSSKTRNISGWKEEACNGTIPLFRTVPCDLDRQPGIYSLQTFCGFPFT